MSLFKTYTPKRLWETTLRLINTMFHTTPSFTTEPKSYFRAVLHAHKCIHDDLKDIFPSDTNESPKDTTIAHVHESLVSLEEMLFGTKTEFPATIEGCCKYTEYMEMNLGSRNMCHII